MGFKSPDIFISAEWIFTITAMLMIFPLQWILAWLAASAVHEIGHITASCLLGVSLSEIRLGITGMRLESQKLTNRQELICASAGPATGLVLLMFSRWIPRVAVCALIQSVCNLLPIYPLDGGRILSGLLHILLPQQIADGSVSVIELFALLLMGCAVIWVSFQYFLGVIPLGIYVVFMMKTGKIKFTCKRGRERVQ